MVTLRNMNLGYNSKGVNNMIKYLMILFCFAFALSAKSVIVIAEEVNVRDNPHASRSKIIQKITQDGVVYPVLAEFSDDITVKTEKGIVGHIYGGLLDQSTGVITAPEGCGVFADAGSKGKAIAVVKNGAIVEIVSKGAVMWYKIDIGWVSAGYVKVVPDKK